jgi:hypothetical protein
LLTPGRSLDRVWLAGSRVRANIRK